MFSPWADRSSVFITEKKISAGSPLSVVWQKKPERINHSPTARSSFSKNILATLSILPMHLFYQIKVPLDNLMTYWWANTNLHCEVTCLTVSPSWLLILRVLSSLPRASRFWALQQPQVIFFVCLPGIFWRGWASQYGMIYVFNTSVLHVFYPVRESCVRSADCKSIGFLSLFLLLTAGWSSTTGWTTSDLCWNQRQW